MGESAVALPVSPRPICKDGQDQSAGVQADKVELAGGHEAAAHNLGLRQRTPHVDSQPPCGERGQIRDRQTVMEPMSLLRRCNVLPQPSPEMQARWVLIPGKNRISTKTLKFDPRPAKSRKNDP